MYEITCMGKGENGFSKDPILHKQTVITKPSNLQLSHGSVNRHGIKAYIQSNLELPLHCTLFDHLKKEVTQVAVAGQGGYISFPLETNDQDYFIQCSAQLEGGTGKKDSKCHKITLVDQLTSNLLNVKYVSYSWLFRYIGIVSIEILIFGCILFCLWR